MTEIKNEIWVTLTDGQSICALINRTAGLGWLMYLRHEGDAGFSSRNPAYRGEADAEIAYSLNNGQLDSYPVAWALPIADIERALEEFEARQQRPEWIDWHDDSI